MKLFQIITTIVGVMMSIGYFPQAYKIYKTKNVASISVPTFIIFAIGTLIWTIYGFVVHDIVLILSFIVGVVGSWLILGLTLYYRNKNTII